MKAEEPAFYQYYSIDVMHYALKCVCVCLVGVGVSVAK